MWITTASPLHPTHHERLAILLLKPSGQSSDPPELQPQLVSAAFDTNHRSLLCLIHPLAPA
jgi:hypothetical protein